MPSTETRCQFRGLRSMDQNLLSVAIATSPGVWLSCLGHDVGAVSHDERNSPTVSLARVIHERKCLEGD